MRRGDRRRRHGWQPRDDPSTADVGDVTHLELAGDVVAFDEGRDVVVADARTGARLLTASVTAPRDFRVQADGTLVVCTPTAIELRSAAAPTPRLLPTPAGCRSLRVTDRGIVYQADDAGLHALDPASGADTLLVPGDRRLLAFDAGAARLVVTRRTCDGTAVYAVPADAPSTLAPEPATCPVGVAGRTLRVRHAMARVKVSCPRGCAGSVLVNQEPSRGSTYGPKTPIHLTGGSATLSVSTAYSHYRRTHHPGRVYVHVVPEAPHGPQTATVKTMTLGR